MINFFKRYPIVFIGVWAFLAVIVLGIFSAYDVQASTWLIWGMSIAVFGPLYAAQRYMRVHDYQDLARLQRKLDTDPEAHIKQKAHVLGMFTNPIVISGIIVFLIAGYFVFSS